MNTQVLEELGLTKSEIEIYLALVKLGPSTVTPLKKQLTISSGKLYEFLGSLNKKGLVTYIKTEKKRLFQASDPQALLGLIEQEKLEIKEREKSVQEFVTDLEKIQNTIPKEGLYAHVYEGLRGLRQYYYLVYHKTLQKGDTQYIMMIPKISNERFEADMLQWHEYRLKKGIKIKYIYNYEDLKYGKKREKMPLSEVRYMRERISTPCYIDIFGDFVGVIDMSDKPKVFVMKGKEVVRTFMFLFDMLWERSAASKELGKESSAGRWQ